MNLTVAKSVRADSAAIFIEIPLSNWTPKLSYLVCRGLVDNMVFPGRVVIGVLRRRVFELEDKTRPYGYSVVHSNYSWIDTGAGVIIDPCNKNYVDEKNSFYHTVSSDEYYAAVDPLTMTKSQLPEHYISDEIYPIQRGLHKEVFMRLLGYNVEVAGLTMVEAAYLASLPVSEIGEHAKMLYEFLIKNDLSKLIPLKNIRKISPRIADTSPQSFRKDFIGDI